MATAPCSHHYCAKEIEFSTADRVYCHRPDCSTFVPPEFVQAGVATCPNCNAATCVACKDTEHGADNCPQDGALQEVLRVARESGWQQCKSCNRLVELTVGCYHMTCLCRAQFCYLCGEPWKTCGCPIWDDNRLLSRAQNLVDRDHRNAQLEMEARAQLIRDAADDLQQNHECERHRWRSLCGEYQCDECGDEMPSFIYECSRCHILACRRCRFNRL
ncbi:hypothetical protein CDD83_1808 [Cordyceps sp. RAO-2017]|nr:hypothetical protein CDD83_1808 [Cordyceps sp. RAO-2017]